MKNRVLFITALIISFCSYSQCPSDQIELEVSITPDAWPLEISWDVLAGNDTLALGLSQGDTLCVDTGVCLTFTIHDAFGDGLVGTAGYYVVYDGDTIISRLGYNYGTGESFTMGCPLSASCETAILIEEGQYTAGFTNTWYEFIADSTGTYEISTCGLTTCNTTLWIYEECTNQSYDNSNIGTLFYDDNEGGCGEQAIITAYLEEGISYVIRVGTVNEVCNEIVDWSIEYQGPVVGCMDQTACNFNPLATVSSGVCFYPGDPECPSGPDLFLREDAIINSIYAVRQDITDQCMVMEGCANGYGTRDLIRFDTWIDNIGDLDFFVGTPQDNPDQFSFTNCHNHPHYEGYAEYLLWDENNEQIPIGFKSGFCVMDLVCDWGTAKYGCGNMGITAGCGDIYNAGLDCQWIDVTDIEDGRYTLLVRTNWDQSPDANGNYEQTYDNNMAQVCFWIDRSSGLPEITVDMNCEPMVDCLGELYGDATEDCTGTCGGITLMGDNDNNGQYTVTDAEFYVSGVMNANLEANQCNDLNEDGEITVYDAALLVNCNNNQSNMDDLCDFPRGTLNPYDTTFYQIDTVDFENKFVDISIYNPYNNVVAFELNLQGLVASTVVSLVDVLDANMTFEVTNQGSKLLGICYDDSSLDKYANYTPVCRVYYSNLSELHVCIDEVISTVNELYEETENWKSSDCFGSPASTLGQKRGDLFVVQPNPASGVVYVQINRPLNVEESFIELVDVLGRSVSVKIIPSEDTLTQINISDLVSGVYYVNLNTAGKIISRKLIVE